MLRLAREAVFLGLGVSLNDFSKCLNCSTVFQMFELLPPVPPPLRWGHSALPTLWKRRAARGGRSRPWW
jgi:hypothetical protein